MAPRKLGANSLTRVEQCSVESHSSILLHTAPHSFEDTATLCAGTVSPNPLCLVSVGSLRSLSLWGSVGSLRELRRFSPEPRRVGRVSFGDSDSPKAPLRGGGCCLLECSSRFARSVTLHSTSRSSMSRGELLFAPLVHPSFLRMYKCRSLSPIGRSPPSTPRVHSVFVPQTSGT